MTERTQTTSGERYRIVVTRTTPGNEARVVDLEGWVPLADLMCDVEGDLINAGLMETQNAD